MAVLRIDMLGKLAMECDGKEVKGDFSRNGKPLQLFLILAWAGEEGITRGKLQDYLYDVRTINTGNALRVVFSRLRRQIQDKGLLCRDVIRYENGIYRMRDEDVTIEVDAVCLEREYTRAMREQDRKIRMQILERAEELYQGEFLPSMSGDSWVESMRGRYQGIYEKCVRELCELLKDAGEEEKLTEVCRKALKLCPMEEWGEELIKSLLRTNRYKDARQVYNEACALFLDHARYGQNEEWKKKYQILDEQIHLLEKKNRDVADELWEKNKKTGAYRCNYLGFLDCFHMYVRISERRQMGGYLVSCSVVSRNGRYMEDGKNKMYTDQLCQVLGEKLRKGDVYTVHSPGRVLILLNQIEKKKVERVKKRIHTAFREKTEGKATLRISAAAVADWVEGKGPEDIKFM